MSATYFIDKVENAKNQVKIEKLRLEIFLFLGKLELLRDGEATQIAQGSSPFLNCNTNYRLVESVNFISAEICTYVNSRLDKIDSLNAQKHYYPK